jgi:hypothetical protein
LDHYIESNSKIIDGIADSNEAAKDAKVANRTLLTLRSPARLRVAKHVPMYRRAIGAGAVNSPEFAKVWLCGLGVEDTEADELAPALVEAAS